MPKKKPVFTVDSYGRYSRWDKSARALPKILEFTQTIEAVEGNEFGLVLKVKSGKGIRLDFTIEHPEIVEDGKLLPMFEGEIFVTRNEYSCFVGDCIWLPEEDKKGAWKITVFWQKKIIVTKTFKIV